MARNLNNKINHSFIIRDITDGHACLLQAVGELINFPAQRFQSRRKTDPKFRADFFRYSNREISSSGSEDPESPSKHRALRQPEDEIFLHTRIALRTFFDPAGARNEIAAR